MVSCLVSLPSVSKAVEFQTPGALGIGGAGVARDNKALTAYWNPAGAAFNKKTVAFKAGVSAGISGSDGLTENIDRLSDISFDRVVDFNTSSGAAGVGEVVKTISIIDDINARKGNLSVNAMVPVGVAVRNVAFGIYGGMEGYVQPIADMVNIIPNDVANGGLVSVSDLVTAVGSGNSASGYFSTDQLNQLIAAIRPSVATDAAAQQLAYAIDSQLNNTDLDPETVLSTVEDQLLPALNTASPTNTLDLNITSVKTMAFQYVEIPLSYGHTVGNSGKLALGVTGKLISGTVYQQQMLLINGDDNLDASDIVDDIRNNKKTSSAIGIDIGALYKYNDKLNFGVVAKNLNSPKFDAPDYDSWNGDINHPVTISGGTVELKPQVRAGVAFEPLGWLAFAADVDLTENDVVSADTSYKSQNLGGGFEFKPASWLQVRAGAYKNIAMGGSPVLTAGFRLFVLNVDGAFATDTFEYDGNEIPQEVKVNASVSFSL